MIGSAHVSPIGRIGPVPGVASQQRGATPVGSERVNMVNSPGTTSPGSSSLGS